ncbi:SRR1-like protein isoform X1 [Schistocerca nitens]|uniref:SRR1-like protein isoform X1 n=2 Tax=Schistocerca nitens TaxID=7011 RepID=UPI0021193789|nr:SRR1-like protein isoform X1 [Schistocerca nitens]
MMLEGDFKLVSAKKRSNKSAQRKESTITRSQLTGIPDINKESAIRRIELAKEEIQESDFYTAVRVVLLQGLKLLNSSEIKEIICYGLGHVAECMTSRYQLGLLLLLKDNFNSEVYIHDPVFYSAECELLRDLNFQLITENEEGKRKLKPSVTTLVYLPHCPKQITNNFLWANWGPQLTNCLLFCNSFNKIVETNPKTVLYTSVSYILNIFPHTEEFGVINSFQYKEIFNDLAIHVFPQKKLDLVASDLWNYCEEPKYSADDTEFITNKLQSSLRLNS